MDLLANTSGVNEEGQGRYGIFLSSRFVVCLFEEYRFCHSAGLRKPTRMMKNEVISFPSVKCWLIKKIPHR